MAVTFLFVCFVVSELIWRISYPAYFYGYMQIIYETWLFAYIRAVIFLKKKKKNPQIFFFFFFFIVENFDSDWRTVIKGFAVRLFSSCRSFLRSLSSLAQMLPFFFFLSIPMRLYKLRKERLFPKPPRNKVSIRTHIVTSLNISMKYNFKYNHLKRLTFALV